MKKYKSEVFGLIQEPENFVELILLLSDISGEDPRVVMWRGQSDIQWPIHHSIL